MAGKATRQIPHWIKLLGVSLAIGLPTVGALRADEKAKVVPAATTSTKPATAPAVSKEAKKADDIARVLEFFKNNQPDAYENALKLRSTDPKKFEAAVLPAISTVNYLDELAINNPALYKLKIENYHLAFQIGHKKKDLGRADLSAGDSAKLQTDLTSLITRQVEVEQGIRAQEISDIEKRVQKLRAELDEREKDKDGIIKRRLERIMKDTGDTKTPKESKGAAMGG